MPRNTTHRTNEETGQIYASMRPRRDAAEYRLRTAVCELVDGASMRPRRDAAEYLYALEQAKAERAALQ